MSICTDRLKVERKLWRKDHPPGFVAKPHKNKDGTANLMIWDCKVPGKDGTPWAKGVYPVTMVFSELYPVKPPKVSLPAGFFHMNVYSHGEICLSIIDEGGGWKPSITIKQILLGVQDLLNEGNVNSPANHDAYKTFTSSKTQYNKRCKKEAAKYIDK